MNKTLNEVLNEIKIDKVFKDSRVWVYDIQGLMFDGKAKDLINMLSLRYVRMMVVSIDIGKEDIDINVVEVD